MGLPASNRDHRHRRRRVEQTRETRMRSPQDMEVIQIEITNACTHRCSNCTRFCGHHSRPFLMDWDTFRSAVDSVAGFTGIVGIMGGEPLLHPEFERFTRYLGERFGARATLGAARRPVADFLTYTRAKHNANRVLTRCKGPGLWTSMPRQYYDHFELIQDTFVFQSLNDHHHASYHQALLVSRKEMGIDDEAWVGLRDRCWIQNCWSASITPKGAFFCEVAASLDMLFDGPGGWPLTSNWWQRQPGDFVDQFHWCEMCGAALQTGRRNANDEVDDVSPALRDALERVQSPKLRRGQVHVVDPMGIEQTGDATGFAANQYISDFSKRLADTNRNLLPKSFDAVALPLVRGGTRADGACRAERTVGEALAQSAASDWVILSRAPQEALGPLRDRLASLYLNPGSTYVIRPGVAGATAGPFADGWDDAPGATVLVNVRAAAFKGVSAADLARVTSLADLARLYPADKQFTIGDDPDGLPSTDETIWRQIVDGDILEDQAFGPAFREVVARAIPAGSAVLVTQSASYFLTRGLVRLLSAFGYDPHVVAHARFGSPLEGLVARGRLFLFDAPESFDAAALAEFADAVAARISCVGAVVPYSVPRSLVVAEDGYAEIEKVAARIARRVIARVNIKRQFVRLAEGATATSFPNPWKY
jgi:hypothetical protein